MKVLVSIIVPTYNRSLLIEETLDSVLAQTYTNWECIIVDDYSTDSTMEILKKYVKKDSRFKVIQKDNFVKRGASASRNIGLQNAKGSYIQFLDSDDVIDCRKLEEQLKVFSYLNDFEIATCKWGIFTDLKEDAFVFDENLYYRNFENSKEYFDLVGQFSGFFPLHCFLIPKKVIEKAGYWNENLSLNDDGEFVFRIFINSSKIIFCSKTFVFYRKSERETLSLLSSMEKAESLVLSWQIIEQGYSDFFGIENSEFIETKKELVYKSLKKNKFSVIKSNLSFFKNQYKKDDDKHNVKYFFKRVVYKIKYVIRIIFFKKNA